MLILDRHRDEDILIHTPAGVITIRLCEISSRTRAKIGVDAPREYLILRGEVAEKRETS